MVLIHFCFRFLLLLFLQVIVLCLTVLWLRYRITQGAGVFCSFFQASEKTPLKSGKLKKG